MTYLLDTNIISEPSKENPNSKVIDWLNQANQETLYISAITIGEIKKGIEQAINPKKKIFLTRWFEIELKEWFTGKILDFDVSVAEHWGALLAKDKRILANTDSLIAATALRHNLKLVTRNTKDFIYYQGLEIINPFD